MKITIPGEPRTKKNSQRILQTKDGRRFVAPSAQYKEYEEMAGWFVPSKGIDHPVNLKCEYYMKTKRKVDLCNLIEATCDILVKYGCLKDDNSDIVVSHDGSRVYYDKENPRVEVTIDESEGSSN
jgi:Holliday junction resolvase RusA-like endonuclease